VGGSIEVFDCCAIIDVVSRSQTTGFDLTLISQSAMPLFPGTLLLFFCVGAGKVVVWLYETIIDAHLNLGFRVRCGEFVKACQLLEYSEEKKSYIDSVFATCPGEIMYTKTLKDVITDPGEGHLDLCLSGPKGCGKSVILASLLYILSTTACVYLSPWSFSSFKNVERLYGRRRSEEDGIISA